MAFALMQGWGNDPGEFAGDKPGPALLDAHPGVGAAGATPPPATVTSIDILLGFDQPTTAVPKRVEWSLHVGDRRLQDGRARHPDAPRPQEHLARPAEPGRQPRRAAAGRDTRDGHAALLIVVSPVPVFGPVVIEQIGQPLAQRSQDIISAYDVGEVPGFGAGDADDPAEAALAAVDRANERGSEKYDREGWSANETASRRCSPGWPSYQKVVRAVGRRPLRERR